MTALLIDIGNTRIKWARLAGRRLGRARAAAHADWGMREFIRLFRDGQRFDRIIVASVAGPELNRALSQSAAHTGGPAPEFVSTMRRACGVTVAYLEPWRLGVDRFMAMIAAHDRFARHATCVVGVGTAMTIDLLGADGRHWGGAIIPAPTLMVESLLKGTNGIRRRAHGGARGKGPALFARSTRAALEQGARFAAAAAVDRAVAEARAVIGRTPRVILTGGGAQNLQPLIQAESILAPDLVLQGLAVWAREG